MPEQAELQRKTGQRGLLITSYNRLKKDSDRAITPAAEAVRVPAHLAPPGFPKAKQLHHLSTLTGAELPQAKKKILHLCAQGHFGSVQLFVSL